VSVWLHFVLSIHSTMFWHAVSGFTLPLRFACLAPLCTPGDDDITPGTTWKAGPGVVGGVDILPSMSQTGVTS
jgi:hypothetical protein